MNSSTAHNVEVQLTDEEIIEKAKENIPKSRLEEYERFKRDHAASDIMMNTRLWLAEKFNTLTIVHETYDDSVTKAGTKGRAMVFFETNVDPEEAEKALVSGSVLKWKKKRKLVTIFQPYDNIDQFEVSITPNIFSDDEVEEYSQSLKPSEQKKRQKPVTSKQVRKHVNKVSSKLRNVDRMKRKYQERQAKKQANEASKDKN